MAEADLMHQRPQVSQPKDPEMAVRGALSAIPGDVREHCSRFFLSDVKEFMTWLNETEHRLTESSHEASTPSLRKEVDARFVDIIDRGEAIVDGIRKPVAKKAVKAAFRRAIESRTAGNPFSKRSLEKPRGYPGDYLMMEMLYANQHDLSGGIAGVLDRFVMDHYECVANRKNWVKAHLRARVARPADSDAPLRILTLGSGPCREWFELEQELDEAERQRFFNSNIHLTCLDQDELALEFCRVRFSQSALVRSVEYVATSLLGFTKSEGWIERAGTFDVVYGAGIADYFYDEMLSSIVTSGFSLLKPDGELTITHKDSETYNFRIADWMYDWVFVRRSEREFAALFRQAVSMLRMPFECRIERDATGEMMFGVARRLP